MRIQHVSPIVEDILETYPNTRNSDALLYVMVCKVFTPGVVNKSFSDVMANANYYGLPSYDSVGRCRRKLQEKHPKLRATKEVTDKRYETYKEVLEYVSQE